MAIDTEAKRKSIAAIAAPWMGPVIVPDGTISGTEKQAIGYSYSGITAASPGGIAFVVLSEQGLHSNVFGGLVLK